MLKQQYSNLRGINKLYHKHEDTAKVYITQSSSLIGREYVETLKIALLHKMKALVFRVQAQHLPIARQDIGHLNRIQFLKDEIYCLNSFILSYRSGRTNKKSVRTVNTVNTVNTYYNKSEKHLMSELFDNDKEQCTFEILKKPIKRYSLKPQGFIR